MDVGRTLSACGHRGIFGFRPRIYSVQTTRSRSTNAASTAANTVRKSWPSIGPLSVFSGTVSPLDLYQRLHGQLKDTNAEQEVTSVALRAQTPFSSEQIKILAVTDINTLYHQRLNTLSKLCQLLSMLQHSRPGRYLLAMPSYQYLNQLAECPDVPQHFLSQTQTMSEGEQQKLLQRFQTMDQAVLGIVMGGVFGESIDLGSNTLSGVVVVSLALPPRRFSQDADQRTLRSNTWFRLGPAGSLSSARAVPNRAGCRSHYPRA